MSFPLALSQLPCNFLTTKFGNTLLCPHFPLFSPPSSSPSPSQDCVPSALSAETPSTTGLEPCINGYICDCREGFFGANCSVDIDYCMSSPCHNNATCEDVVGGTGYICVCVRGYTGTDCEAEIDESSLHLFSNTKCYNHIGSFIIENH